MIMDADSRKWGPILITLAFALVVLVVADWSTVVQPVINFLWNNLASDCLARALAKTLVRMT